MPISKKYEKYSYILEGSIDDMNANEENFESKGLERHAGRKTDTDECAFKIQIDLRNVDMEI